mmetsp:Transcript_34785/g.33912  ORF Transcript_34785/g.33912 Transcript_34785/m.33912 type:complete len:96 (-) Transcript_34785:211-498(-)
MPFGTTLHIFIEGIKPAWEDENCKEGGRWIMRIPKSHSNLFWENLVLAMIGEQFRCADEIIGMVIVLKPNHDNISVWNRHGLDEEKVKIIREDIE